jgi:DNA-binding NtrC family response regulator
MEPMKLDGEIILIDNDRFEFDFLKEALHRLNYDVGVVYFQTAIEGFEYLKQTQNEIFLIISEIDFDGMDGLALKKAINEEQNTHWKSIPFVFIANEATKETVDEAYKHEIHGLFRKPPKLEQLTDLFSAIIKYWMMNLHPNQGDNFYAIDWYNASN